VLFYLFFTISLAIILLSSIQNASGEPRNLMGFSVLRVVTPSMEPELPVNSLIIIRQEDPNNLEVDQIATYLRPNGELVTHRIAYIEEDADGNNSGFILRGDANQILTYQVVPSEDVLGRVVFSSYGIGRILVFFGNILLITVIVTIVLLVLLYEGKRRVVKKLKANSNNDAPDENENQESNKLEEGQI